LLPSWHVVLFGRFCWFSQVWLNSSLATQVPVTHCVLQMLVGLLSQFPVTKLQWKSQASGASHLNSGLQNVMGPKVIHVPVTQSPSGPFLHGAPSFSAAAVHSPA